LILNFCAISSAQRSNLALMALMSTPELLRGRRPDEVRRRLGELEPDPPGMRMCELRWGCMGAY
jgi:hypothetical protein